MDPNVLWTLLLLIFILNIHITHCNNYYSGNDTRQTEMLNKHKGTIKTYKNKYGDIFDCVNIYQQPSFDDPFIKNHTIERSPPIDISINVKSVPKHSKVENDRNVIQSCPKGTIPIIRSNKHEIRTQAIGDLPGPFHREYAYVGTTERHRPSITGASGDLDIPYPQIAYDNEYSLAHVSLVSSFYNDDHISVEAGWKVSGDSPNIPRFFIRWTVQRRFDLHYFYANEGDGYKNTGCFNLECPGFIQTNYAVRIGGPLPEPNRGNVLRIEIRQRAHGNWWLFKDGQPVGYWLVGLLHLQRLTNGAEQAIFGGEIINRNLNNRHTSTEMGNGLFLPVDDGAEYCATIKDIKVRGTSSHTVVHFPTQEYVYYVSNPTCYGAEVFYPRTGGSVSMYYGGPGYHEYLCP